MQLVFCWAPKLARKCESKHWFPRGADGRTDARSLGVRSRDYQIFWDGYIYLAMELRYNKPKHKRSFIFCLLKTLNVGPAGI